MVWVIALVCFIAFGGLIMAPEIYHQSRKTLGAGKKFVLDWNKPKPFPEFTPGPLGDPRALSFRDRLVDIYDNCNNESTRNSCLIIMNSQLQHAIDLAREARTNKFLVQHLSRIEPLIEGLEAGRWAEVALKIQTFDNYLDQVERDVILPNALDLSHFKALEK